MPVRAPALPPEQRRAAIIAATLPLVLERGGNVSTRQIADAAGIAEGTIFGVFPDKDAVLQAVLLAALDTEPAERELAAIDRSRPLEDQLTDAVAVMQRRAENISRLLSGLGSTGKPHAPPADFVGLADLFRAHRDELRTDPVAAARQLRAITLAFSTPAYFAGKPMKPREIATLFLHGVRSPQGNAASGGDRQ